MKIRELILSAALGAAVAAQAEAQIAVKAPDVCTPPASRNAPSLPARLLEGQGTEHINFPITTSSAEAQKFFLQGVAQMHSFWAVEAERSFLHAAALDPQAPMPWWGVAMVAMGDFRPRFQLEGYGLGGGKIDPRVEEAVRKARELSEVVGKATDLEKMYIAAIAARRDPKAANPDNAYLDGLRAIVVKYPQEVEAESYLALHLMRGFETPAKKPRQGSEEAVARLRDLARKFPNHPGVHHYIIHGWEGSTFAQDAWESCKRYAELAPNIPHALHMPGHIYAQTGRWQDAVKSFSDAAENELKWIKADSLYSTGHHGHNVHFLVTSHSFQAQVDEAIARSRHLLELGENPREKAMLDNNRTAYRQGWFALLRTLVQNERWDQIMDGATLPVYEKPRETAWRQWALGLAYVAKGDAKAARQALNAMDEAFDLYQDKVKQAVPAELRVARRELIAQIRMTAKKKKPAAVIANLEKVAERERGLIYSEPPYYPRPVEEAIGRIALEAGNLDAAANAFRKALAQYPSSAKATAGLKEVERRQSGSGPAADGR
ncbi:MAG: tetratricopeptide repeat protein [Acidobacteria bacterium]|nr:tetratricopeptide repeat protein [Acidobacteriota bacterium]